MKTALTRIAFLKLIAISNACTDTEESIAPVSQSVRDALRQTAVGVESFSGCIDAMDAQTAGKRVAESLDKLLIS